METPGARFDEGGVGLEPLLAQHFMQMRINTMNGVYHDKLPSIYPATLHLNELKLQLDEEIQKHSSFEIQKNIYLEILRTENVIKGLTWRMSKQFEHYWTEN